jgi:hypothetical protein
MNRCSLSIKQLIPEHVFKLFIYLFINQTQTIMNNLNSIGQTIKLLKNKPYYTGYYVRTSKETRIIELERQLKLITNELKHLKS